MPRSTLTSQPGSMLSVMFSGKHQLRTDDIGRVYLDRSGKQFDYILDYLTNGGSLPAPPTESQELERVRAGKCTCKGRPPSSRLIANIPLIAFAIVPYVWLETWWHMVALYA